MISRGFTGLVGMEIEQAPSQEGGTTWAPVGEAGLRCCRETTTASRQKFSEFSKILDALNRVTFGQHHLEFQSAVRSNHAFSVDNEFSLRCEHLEVGHILDGPHMFAIRGWRVESFLDDEFHLALELDTVVTQHAIRVHLQLGVEYDPVHGALIFGADSEFIVPLQEAHASPYTSFTASCRMLLPEELVHVITFMT